jgi:hypothetical protein
VLIKNAGGGGVLSIFPDEQVFGKKVKVIAMIEASRSALRAHGTLPTCRQY